MPPYFRRHMMICLADAADTMLPDAIAAIQRLLEFSAMPLPCFIATPAIASSCLRHCLSAAADATAPPLLRLSPLIMIAAVLIASHDVYELRCHAAFATLRADATLRDSAMPRWIFHVSMPPLLTPLLMLMSAATALFATLPAMPMPALRCAADDAACCYAACYFAMMLVTLLWLRRRFCLLLPCQRKRAMLIRYKILIAMMPPFSYA